MSSYRTNQSWAKEAVSIFVRASACRIRNITRNGESALFSRLKAMDLASVAIFAACFLTVCLVILVVGKNSAASSFLAIAPILAVVKGETPDEGGAKPHEQLSPLIEEARRRGVDPTNETAMGQLRRRLAREAEPRRLVYHFNLAAKPGEFVAVRCDDSEFAAKLFSAAKYDPHAGDSCPTIEIENPCRGPNDARQAIVIPLGSARAMREGEALIELSWAGLMELSPTTRHEVAERAERRRNEIVYYAGQLGDAIKRLDDPQQGLEPLKAALYNLALLEQASSDIRRDLEDLRHARPIR